MKGGGDWDAAHLESARRRLADPVYAGRFREGARRFGRMNPGF